MFENIRYRIATYYAKKAHNEIEKGDFEAIMKGFDYLKKSISIVPPSKELKQFGSEMKKIAETHELKIKEESSR